MKTLDEVIKALEYCTGFDFVRCQDCPGYCEPDCGTQNDALHYLKELRHILDNTVFVNSTKEENGYWKLPTLPETGNDPLQWDDLKAMEGKPVWIEQYWYPMEDETGATEDEVEIEKYWTIIDKVQGKRIHFVGKNLSMGMTRINLNPNKNGGWQAYRKERNENAGRNYRNHDADL